MASLIACAISVGRLERRRSFAICTLRSPKAAMGSLHSVYCPLGLAHSSTKLAAPAVGAAAANVPVMYTSVSAANGPAAAATMVCELMPAAPIAAAATSCVPLAAVPTEILLVVDALNAVPVCV